MISFTFLLKIVLLMFIIDLDDSYDTCIQPYNQSTELGFEFKNCTDAVIAIKWRTYHVLVVWIDYETNDTRKFQLFLNDDFELKFEGAGSTKAKWTLSNDSIGTSCETIEKCLLLIADNGILQLSTNGKQLQYNDRPAEYAIDDEWVWTKIEVVNLPYEYTLQISSNCFASQSCIDEYTPISTNRPSTTGDLNHG
ncbi:hypothetical protein M3Y96_00300900 [Aphelenchoides besseyi]|nr:hypothetical protein M3Y96_00300900 [Aphelenchoides besseyi]